MRDARTDRSSRSIAFATVTAVLLLGAGGCWWEDDPDPPTTTSGANLTEQEAIGLVKGHVEQASRSTTERRETFRRTPCSAQRAATDPSCTPCAPGSPNFCHDEWVWEDVEVPGRCTFPPSQDASWSAEYRASSRQWDVESSDPYATGLNRWTVDDPTASILSGYCYP